MDAFLGVIGLDWMTAAHMANDTLLSLNLSSEIAALVRLLSTSNGSTQLSPVQVAAPGAT